jgi:hypothetical protein
VGLSLVEIFALGAARGKSKIFSKFLATLCFGILTATVLFPAVAILEILEFSFFFRINVIGPGQKTLKSFKKLLFSITSFFKSSRFYKCIIVGFIFGLFFKRKIFLTDLSEYAFPARP